MRSDSLYDMWMVFLATCLSSKLDDVTSFSFLLLNSNAIHLIEIAIQNVQQNDRSLILLVGEIDV